jgi:hypothetical protein
VDRAGLQWGKIGGWEDMVFRLKRSRNLQTLSVDSVLSVKVGEVLKILLMGTRQIGQIEDPPVIHLPRRMRKEPLTTSRFAPLLSGNTHKSAERHAASVEDPRSYRERPLGSPGTGGLDSESEASDHEDGGGRPYLGTEPPLSHTQQEYVSIRSTDL